ncbi:MAG: 4-phosphoerythronate dehydrogenase [Verrucomicrobiota bacterium]|jgi:erythronate-4-phosphate dehydrogenase|nr:4-phosphoerythronate dehydrogenase [Verrucomicrobiota bacterium]
MKIVCAASVAFAREAFSSLGDLHILPDRAIRREDLLDAEVLIVRSKTRVTPELLEGTAVHFVATATAGADHLDVDYLTRSGIAWCVSPGCNANSVAEYVMSALCLLARQTATPLPGRTLGLIGVGQVGSRVQEKAQALGLRVLLNDPPKALHEAAEKDYLDLEEFLPQVEMLSLHTPLTQAPPFPTRHLANWRLLGQLKPGTWFINTSRGAVADSEAILCGMQHHHLSACVLDVWEGEPTLFPGLSERVDALTPHIAGYSLEGLLNGTLQCYRELCHYLELEPTWTPDARMLPVPELFSCNAAGHSDEEILCAILTHACPIPTDSKAWRAEMKAAADERDLRMRFDRFRRNYPIRREFAAHRIQLSNASGALLDAITALGFQICADPP